MLSGAWKDTGKPLYAVIKKRCSQDYSKSLRTFKEARWVGMCAIANLLRPVQGQQRPTKAFRKLGGARVVFPMKYEACRGLGGQQGPVKRRKNGL